MRKLSPYSVQSRARVVGGLLALVAAVGCARFPDVPTVQGTRITFTLNVAGTIRTGQEPGGTGVPYVYMVALRTSTDDTPTTQGPIPVIGPPWGNGFVAGNATHFVWWDPTQQNDTLIYRFVDAQLNNFLQVGVPVSEENVPVGARRIRFEILLTQLVTTPSDADLLRSLQVNFLTMDRIPQTGTQKQWDALGDGRIPSQVNQFVTIPLRRNGIYNNLSSGNIEPVGDQPNPELDISDWTIEVRVD